MNYAAFHPTRCITAKGKILVAVIRFLYGIRRLLGFPQWKQALPKHHEDPLRMDLPAQLYLGYKYYYKAIIEDDNGGAVARLLQNQDVQLQVPETFIPQQTISFSAGGDLIPYDCITEENCRHLWDEAGPFFFNNDIVFANLETAADPSQKPGAAPEVMLNDMYFNIHEDTFKIFEGNGQYKGFDILSTANNHSKDRGVEGIIATQHFLRNKNIPYCGTALSRETRDEFPILERNGIKVAFIAYTFSMNKETLAEGQEWLCNHLDLNKKDADISLIIHQATVARERGADIVVASLHMGCAYQTYPQQYTVDNMHRICEEAGVDVLIGGHPHNAQPVELYTTKNVNTGAEKQHLIVYSLGDFIAYDIYKWCHLPLILQLQFTKGKLGDETQTFISKIGVKPYYFYRNKKGELRLVDFLRAEKKISENFAEKEVQNEVKELSDFLHRFVVTEKQQHILV